jgi:hypothetical protein
MARDARNNEIEVGDVVSLEIPSTRVVGDVQTVTNGGIVTGIRRNDQQASPGMVVVLVAFQVLVDPAHPIIGNMLKLHQAADVEAEKPHPVIELSN